MKPVLSALLALLLPTLALATTIPNDPQFEQQWYLGRIEADEAWDVYRGNRDVVVAVIDTGVDIQHPDLQGNIFVNTNEVPGDGIDNDGNGYIDDISGWDFFDSDNDPRPDVSTIDPAGVHHGTVIAGLIGAQADNGQGIAGVNWNVQILPLRVLDGNGDGFLSDITAAIDYASAMGADVINMSFVGDFRSRLMDETLQRAYDNNVVIVAALGNNDGGQNLNSSPLYPVCSNGTRGENIVIGVTATNQTDHRASFSNYGSDCADIAAPGVFMHSTQATRSGADYGSLWHGTSFAAPLVAGSAALLRAAYPTATPHQILMAMQFSVDPLERQGIVDGLSSMGAGRLNSARALNVMAQLTGLSPIASQEPSSVRIPTVGSQQGAVVIGAGAGDVPRVVVYQQGTRVGEWLAYAEGFRGGVRVALGDLDGDGIPEVVTAPGVGGGPHIRIFRLDGTLLGQFFATDVQDRNGVFVTLADYDQDGRDEIITTTGNQTHRLRVFDVDGRQLAERLLSELPGPAYLDAANVDQDAGLEFVLTAAPGNAPAVFVLDQDRVQSVVQAYAPSMTLGVPVSVMGEGPRAKLLTGVEEGGGPHVRQFSPQGALAGQFFATETSNRAGVVPVAWTADDGSQVILNAMVTDAGPELVATTVSGTSVNLSFSTEGFTQRVHVDAYPNHRE